MKQQTYKTTIQQCELDDVKQGSGPPVIVPEQREKVKNPMYVFRWELVDTKTEVIYTQNPSTNSWHHTMVILRTWIEVQEPA